MSSAPSFQFYPKQILGDDKVALMDTREFGAHMFLICYAWQQTPPCTVPDDDEVLAKWTRLTLSNWRKIREKVLYSWKLKKGRFVSEGLLREYKKQKQTSVQRRNAALKMWDSKRNANAKQKQCSSSSSSSSTSYKYSPQDKALAEKLFALIQKRDSKAKKPNIESWADSIRKLNQLDERPIDEIEKVIDWCQADSFWSMNILSAAKLREKYQQLKLKMPGGSGQIPDQTHDYQKKADACYSREPDETKNNPNSCRGIRGNHCRLCFKKKVKP